MIKKTIKWYLLSIMFLLCVSFIPYTLSKYFTTFSKKITINARQPEYDVIFNSNDPIDTTVSGTMTAQHFIYGIAQNLNSNTYEVEGYTFTGWCTKADGKGDFYSDGELVDKLIGTDGGIVHLYAQWRDVVAEIDGVYYSTLQAAINAVPTNNTETTIKLLWNTSESVNIKSNQNIVFDLQNYTISNNGSSQVIINKGTIAISNGTIRSSAGYAAIDNDPSGKIIMSGGKIIATGERQTIYNRGIVEISGNAYLSSAAPQRATVQNQDIGTLIITGGTLISSTQQAVQNAGTLTIGIKDGDVDKTTPLLQGATNGIDSTKDFNFYNGIIKGKENAIGNLKKIIDKEEDYEVVLGRETIDGVSYETAYLANASMVTFNPNGGSLSNNQRAIETGKVIGIIPTPSRSGAFIFDGWFTAKEGGDKITEETVVTEDVTYYAHWIEIMVAEVNGKQYKTLQAAINTVPKDDTQTIVKLINDTRENIKINEKQNIVFDFQDYTLSNNSNAAVVTNNGTIKIFNGTITTTATSASAINNNSKATLIMSGGKIIATGERQAVYNDGGYVEISGNAYLSSKITVSGERGTVQNLASSTMVIKGGTIVSTTNQALYNEGTLTIGIEDGNVNSTSPIFQGATYGIKSTKDFSLYDGIMKGKTAAIANEEKITNKEEGYTLTHETEVIDEVNYDIAYLK